MRFRVKDHAKYHDFFPPRLWRTCVWVIAGAKKTKKVKTLHMTFRIFQNGIFKTQKVPISEVLRNLEFFQILRNSTAKYSERAQKICVRVHGEKSWDTLQAFPKSKEMEFWKSEKCAWFLRIWAIWHWFGFLNFNF
jgi:hypothetical protein